MNEAPVQELVFSPTEAWLKPQLASCTRRLIIVSPYITDALSDILTVVHPSVRKTVFTCLKTKNFTQRSSSLQALWRLYETGVKLYQRENLHAKIYLMDRDIALVTSANATHGGFKNNIECGIASRDPAIIANLEKRISENFNTLASPLTPITEEDICRLEVKVRKYNQQREAATPPVSYKSTLQ